MSRILKFDQVNEAGYDWRSLQLMISMLVRLKVLKG